MQCRTPSLHVSPVQKTSHVHCPGCVQMPFSQGGLHICVLQAGPFQPSTHVHVPEDVHVPPLAHVGLQTAVELDYIIMLCQQYVT